MKWPICDYNMKTTLFIAYQIAVLTIAHQYVGYQIIRTVFLEIKLCQSFYSSATYVDIAWSLWMVGDSMLSFKFILLYIFTVPHSNDYNSIKSLATCKKKNILPYLIESVLCYMQ